MGFTVNHQGSVKDAEFIEYIRLLRQTGHDLGKLPRIPDPNTHKRWLYFWNIQNEADSFAKKLKKETRDPGWKVMSVSGPPSEGPLGPIVIQFVRSWDGLTFGLHILSQILIQSAFPQAVSAITFATIRPEPWNDYKKAKGGLEALLREVLPPLTGLTLTQLDELGYLLLDSDSDETLVTVPPAQLLPR